VDTLTRRRFLIASGVTGGAALVAGSAAVTWEQLRSRAASDPLPAGANVLVVVTLYGGNDGLNTVIPYAEPAYHDARPELAYAASDVLHLDGALGLNPAMKGMAALWQQQHLAIVRGVGYPKPDHSHFRSMDIWQTASPDEPVQTGWIGRWLDATGDDPVRAVNIGSVLPPLAVGVKATAAALPLGSAQPLAAPLASAVTALGKPDPTDGPAAAQVCLSYRAERTAAATLGAALNPSGTEPDHDQPTPAGSAGGQSSLKQQLDVVGRCIKAGVPTRVYAVSLGGFDTHADEKGTQSRLLGELDGAVSGFLEQVAGRKVVVAVYSEFGRRVAANASDGTDHGTAGSVLIAGDAVRGGFVGDQPSLTALVDGDLQVTTDFRAVYGTLREKVLGTEAGRVLDGTRPALDFL
jgi:uncharacterized protein (DUF1501 family)